MSNTDHGGSRIFRRSDWLYHTKQTGPIWGSAIGQNCYAAMPTSWQVKFGMKANPCEVLFTECTTRSAVGQKSFSLRLRDLPPHPHSPKFPVQAVMTISSKLRHFCFGIYPVCVFPMAWKTERLALRRDHNIQWSALYWCEILSLIVLPAGSDINDKTTWTPQDHFRSVQNL